MSPATKSWQGQATWPVVDPTSPHVPPIMTHVPTIPKSSDMELCPGIHFLEPSPLFHLADRRRPQSPAFPTREPARARAASAAPASLGRVARGSPRPPARRPALGPRADAFWFGVRSDGTLWALLFQGLVRKGKLTCSYLFGLSRRIFTRCPCVAGFRILTLKPVYFGVLNGSLSDCLRNEGMSPI